MKVIILSILWVMHFIQIMYESSSSCVSTIVPILPCTWFEAREVKRARLRGSEKEESGDDIVFCKFVYVMSFEQSWFQTNVRVLREWDTTMFSKLKTTVVFMQSQSSLNYSLLFFNRSDFCTYVISRLGSLFFSSTIICIHTWVDTIILAYSNVCYLCYLQG